MGLPQVQGKSSIVARTQLTLPLGSGAVNDRHRINVTSILDNASGISGV